jgi:hydroxyacylglutathione hydrolase
MLFERIESPGLAHYSYLVGDGGEAFVVDPRRDCDVYVEKTCRGGFRIAHILETHRNEDYVVGSVELAARTEARIWHADAQWDYRYGSAAQDGQTWRVGRLEVQAIHSPGHTPGSMSYLLRDVSGAPWVVFTGDALFAGDVGRVDFLGPDRMEEMAGRLYDTLFSRLLSLGDEVIVCPAHGSGSICAAAIADRVWTTIGLERRLNPKLQYAGRSEFVAGVAKELERAPYLRRMERWNLEGPPLLGALPIPLPLDPETFLRRAQDAVVLDTRTELAFGAGHVPGALSIWLDGLPRFGGWFLPYDKPILLVNETDDPVPAARYLLRLGYDNVAGYLAGGLLAWHLTGRASEAVPMVNVQELCRLLDAQGDVSILDVRGDKELEAAGRITGAQHIHLTQLLSRLEEVPRNRPLYVFCGSGLRSMVAASLLQRQGWGKPTVVLGGLAGWRSTTCPLE